MQTTIENIKHIVEQALGQKINLQPNAKDLLIVDAVTTDDQLALIKHYLNNQHLVNEQLIADLVGKQLNRYPLETVPNLPAAQTWADYLHKLEILLEQAKYRKANNYEYHVRMPTQQQLMQLQQECWQLTELWYGSGKANLACFYYYFVAMSQAAGVTCFAYDQIGKFISPDHYISVINVKQRLALHQKHEKYYHDFIQQGGIRARGRSAIDATCTSNIFYHKSAQLNFNFQFAKKLVVAALDLEDYGQLPYEQRLHIWHLLQTHYPDNTTDDGTNIFYKYVEFLNARPGEYFNYFAVELPEINKASPQMLHDIIKIAGLQTNHLVLLSRDVVDNWIPKRHFNIQWTRKYALTQIDHHHGAVTIRPAGATELVRFLPNELPYAPGHGLSLCGDGLIDGAEQYATVVYEWNTPIDQKIEFNNWPRDIEKLFREFKVFIPQIKHKERLLGERLINMFHNSMAYSTIHTTQHSHLMSTPQESFLLYMLPATVQYEIPHLNATIDLVQIGTLSDALYVRFNFSELENETLIKFLLNLNDALFNYFKGNQNLDVHLQLFANEEGSYAFIYEPHAFLTPLDNDRFLNPHNNIVTPRRPQFLRPEGNEISYLRNEMAVGLEYCRRFFDDTCKPGVYHFIVDFIHQAQQTH